MTKRQFRRHRSTVFSLSIALIACVACLPCAGGEETSPSDATKPSTTQAADETPNSSPHKPDVSDDRLGVQTMCTNCNEANLELGGLDDARIGVDFDGFALSGGLPRIYAFSILPTSAIERLDVAPGPGRADGPPEAIGGSVALVSQRRSRRPQLEFGAQAGSYGWSKLSALGRGRLGPLTGRLALTESRSAAIDADGDGNVETGALDQWTGLGEIELELGKAGRLLAGATRIEDDQIDGHGQVELNPLDLQPIGYLKEDTYVRWQEYHVGYDLSLGPAQSLRLRVSRFDRDQRIVAPVASSSEPKRERYLIAQRTTHLDLRWRGTMGTRWALSAGFQADDDDVSVEGRALPVYQPRAEESVSHRGGFAQLEVALGSTVGLTAGTRYDSYDLDSGTATAVYPDLGVVEEIGPISRSKWSPRGEITWKPTGSVQIKGSVGYGFAAPKPAFTEICCGQSPETNAGLEPERSRAVALDLTYQPSPALKFNLYAHQTDFDNYIIKMVAGSIGLKQKLKQANIASVTLQGISGLVSWKSPSGLNLVASVTQLDAHNNGETVRLLAFPFAPVPALFPVTLPLTRVPYIAERSAELALRYEPMGGPVSFSITAQYTGSMLIQHYDNVAFSPLPPGGLRSDYRETSGFWVINLAGRFALEEHLDLAWGVDNLFGEIQSDLADFTTDYNWGPIRGTYAYGGVVYHY